MLQTSDGGYEYDSTDYDQMLDTKGNTAIYLLYAHARLESILSKAKDNFSVNVNDLVSDKTPIIISAPSRELTY